MIITRNHAHRLIRRRQATETGLTSGGDSWPDHPHLVAVDRHDQQRVDHYHATEADEERLAK